MAVPTGCREAVERLWDLVDGRLGEADQHLVEQHLAFCRRCCGELEFARELRGLLTRRTDAPIPGDVRSRLEGMIDALDAPDPGAPR